MEGSLATRTLHFWCLSVKLVVNHFTGVLKKIGSTDKENENLADQKSYQISRYPGDGDAKQNPINSYTKTKSIEKKAEPCFSKSIQNAEEGIVGIEERANPCQRYNIVSSERTVEEKSSNPIAKE